MHRLLYRRSIVGTVATSISSSSRCYSMVDLPVTLGSFGSLCFNTQTMKNYMDRNTFNEVKDTLTNKKQFSHALTEKFAEAAHAWAVENGCTHKAHVFQPLSGVFGEKHDALFTVNQDGLVNTSLKVSKILAAEPDASSFPNGGLRDTHKARGNAVWDPQSHLTIGKLGEAPCLRIPSVFVSWSGEALDMKTPLLRSEQALQTALLRIFEITKEPGHTRVHTYSGLEQEFFLVEEKYYEARPDLQLTGRMLLGKDSSRGQAHSDRYFGWQSTRMQNCLFDMEQELWRLGIPNSTRHREVAPAQYEMAPTYDFANQAVDNNILMMEVMKEVAKRHDLACLLHEKPFANLNGSGKHNNWSFGTNRDRCILQPTSPYFMIATAAFIRATHIHGGLLRASIASAGNDHRLGGHEAPPGIMSIYLGEEVTEMVEAAAKGEVAKPRRTDNLANFDFGVNYMPAWTPDASDRNRTSPIAFCGDRFEFRALGSSSNPAWSTTVLNTITADSLHHIADRLEAHKNGVSPITLRSVIADVLSEHKAVIYNGDNYSDAWKKESASRGLLNCVDTPDSLPHLLSDSSRQLFSKLKVLSESELTARSNVNYSNFYLDVSVEIQVLLDLCRQHVIPSVHRQLNDIHQVDKAYGKEEVNFMLDSRKRIFENLSGLTKAVDQLDKFQEKVNSLGDDIARSAAIKSTGRGLMNEVRKFSDKLEGQIAASYWSLPTVQQLIHEGH